MKVTVTLQGAHDLAARLRSLPDAISRRVEIEALTAGAELIRAEASHLAPRGHAGAPHLADDIVVSAPTVAQLERGGHEDTAVEVGPSRKPHDHFYGFFVEFGTAKSRAFPFMRPAFDRQAQSSLNRVLAEFWVAIRKALPTSFQSGNTGGGTL